jgi:hypothetical protein
MYAMQILATSKKRMQIIVQKKYEEISVKVYVNYCLFDIIPVKTYEYGKFLDIF